MINKAVGLIARKYTRWCGEVGIDEAGMSIRWQLRKPLLREAGVGRF